MKRFLQRLLKFFAYTAAGIVIVLAIAVGLFRLFLPRLPEYQEEIKGWASTAIGMEVQFSGMDARWGLSGPELEFYDTELIRPGAQARLIAAEEVRVGVALTRLLVDRKLVVDRVVVSGTSVEIRQREDGQWWVQGVPADALAELRAEDAGDLSGVVVVGEDIEVIFLQPGDQRPRFFDVVSVVVSADANRLAFDADVRLPEDLGRRLELSATQLYSQPEDERQWDVTIDAPDVDLSGWSEILLPEGRRLESGGGDLDLSLAYAGGDIRNASIDIDLADITVQDNEPFDLRGRFEYISDEEKRLIATEEYRLSTTNHAWPEASLRIEAINDAEGNVTALEIRSSYLRVDDYVLLLPWIEEEQRQLLVDSDPTGVVQDLVATVSNVTSESPGFTIDARLDAVGMAEREGWPGVRGFSGVVRANDQGGLLEIQSTDVTAVYSEYYDRPVNITFAEGAVIWRNGDTNTTVISDGIRIRNDLFDSESNLQLTIERDGSSPVIDLASSWSINDVSEVDNFIPGNLLKPRLREWFQTAFVAGSVPRGSMVLLGPLDKFPFDNDEGRFLVEATIRNLVFDYHPRWPRSRQSTMEIVLDKMRLYSTRNQSLNSGNRIVDATIEIADLRDPILEMQAVSTGTLETIRAFTSQSPIADVFGDHLERVTVTGEATFGIDLVVPLLDPQAFDFTARLNSSSGTLEIEGFGPQVTNLVGDVTIRRDDISSEALSATFLGQPVTIDLSIPEDPRFSVVAATEGVATATAIVEELQLPLEGVISGSTPYRSRILFPKRDDDTESQFTIEVESDLEGFAIELPEPVGKPAESTLEIRGDIRLSDGGGVIESAGFAENHIAWDVAFVEDADTWDLDRGVITMGRDVMQPAEVRGLHIRGTAGTVRLDEWLSLSRSGEEKSGVAERIRSIDLVIEDLFAVGQHLKGHHVRVDRSARDWLVQVEGEHVVGSIFVPYEFDTERAMVVEMQRLHMPGDEVSPVDDSSLDPRTLPPITLKADDFALGDRNLGTVDAQVNRVPGGLEAASILTKDETFQITAAGRWLVDETNPSGSRTFVSGTMTSTDVEPTMARLGFAPGIVSKKMTVGFDIGFPGGPRADYLEVLDGEVDVEFGAGQLEEVEPGAGRMFGLLSITALPRRLSLDFRDVFNKGFGFDKIAGKFRIVEGEAFTCDLSLEGPAADIGIVGRASLVDRDYDQTAVVSANVGNTLPIMGAVVAGPQAAAALLIFSQIFKKPLQEVGQVYYSISGSWDEPATDSTDSQSFAADSELAGCLVDAE